ncbi:MAG: amino acid-binding protein, partial [Clostridiales bacterium]
MAMRQISVFVENKPGRMAKITAVLAAGNIDIRALSLADTNDFGILRMIVDKPDQAVTCLKGANITVSITEVIGIGISDTPGAFSYALEKLGAVGIDVEYMYAFLSRDSGKAFVILRVKEID